MIWLAVSLVASALWIAVLGYSSRVPARRLWPPRRADAPIIAFAWIATTAIHVGCLFSGLETGSEAYPWLRYGLAVPLGLAGTFLHGWGTQTLGLARTSGVRGPVETGGPYRHVGHPQYLGQGLMLCSYALGTLSVDAAVAATAGCIALTFAARLEDRHLGEPA